jgi:hypothetical protein
MLCWEKVYTYSERINVPTVCLPYTHILGHAINPAVSRWFPTAAARVLSQVRPCGISIRGWYIRPTSGRRTKRTQFQPTQRIKKNNDHTGLPIAKELMQLVMNKQRLATNSLN